MKKNVGAGSTLATNSWTNDLGPYFSWNQAVDNEGGVGIKAIVCICQMMMSNPNLKRKPAHCCREIPI